MYSPETYCELITLFRQQGYRFAGICDAIDETGGKIAHLRHDIDYSPVQPNPALEKSLAALPGRKLIFTAGDVPHAEKVMERLGVAHHFEAIFDIVAGDYWPKPHQAIYDKLVVKLVPLVHAATTRKPGSAAGQIWMAPDSPRPLVQALTPCRIWCRWTPRSCKIGQIAECSAAECR